MLQHGSWLFVGACCSLFGVFILLLPFHHYRIKNEWMKLYIWCVQTFTQNLACSQCQLPTVHTWNVMRVKCFGENINRETVFSPNILMLAWFACFVLWFESHWLFVVDFVPPLLHQSDPAHRLGVEHLHAAVLPPTPQHGWGTLWTPSGFCLTHLLRRV